MTRSGDDDRSAPTREEILICRAVDDEASPDDWRELEELATRDPALWTRLARAQQAHARLTRALDDELAIAELVALPAPAPLVVATRRSPSGWAPRWAGWAMAAAVALAWGGWTLLAPPPAAPSGPDAGGIRVEAVEFDSRRAYREYLRDGIAEGRIVSELTPVLVDDVELPAERGIEAYIMRRILERVIVEDRAALDALLGDRGAAPPAADDGGPI